MSDEERRGMKCRAKERSMGGWEIGDWVGGGAKSGIV